MDAESLRIDFENSVEATIAALRAANVVMPDEYYGEMDATARRVAFTVSALAKLAQIQAVADALEKVIAEGGTFDDFLKWAADQDWTLPKSRLETIFRNAAQTAYMGGHWRRFREMANDLPYLMYDAINDSRTRPSHLALDGFIRPVNDPVWRTHTPPLGHNCRCTLRQLSARQAMLRGGLSQSKPIEGGPDDGWGGDPNEHADMLDRLLDDRLSAFRDL